MRTRGSGRDDALDRGEHVVEVTRAPRGRLLGPLHAVVNSACSYCSRHGSARAMISYCRRTPARSKSASRSDDRPGGAPEYRAAAFSMVTESGGAVGGQPGDRVDEPAVDLDLERG